MIVVTILFKIIVCIFIVDFLSGLFHWLEDSYGHENWPIIGDQITKPNILHHHDPRYFTRHSWLYSARVLLVLAAIILPIAHILGFLNWMTILVVFIGINANEIHKWAHRSKTENGRLITTLQKTGIIQSPIHHAAHHRDPKNSDYCVITNYLNPVLEAIHLWTTLEALILKLFGVQRRLDTSVKSNRYKTAILEKV